MRIDHATRTKAEAKLSQLGTHVLRGVDTLRTLSVRYRVSVSEIMRLNKLSSSLEFLTRRSVVVPKDRSSACSRGCVVITGKGHLVCHCTAHKVTPWRKIYSNPRCTNHYEMEMAPMNLGYGSINDFEEVPTVTFSSVVIRAAPAVVMRSAPKKKVVAKLEPSPTGTATATVNTTTAATAFGTDSEDILTTPAVADEVVVSVDVTAVVPPEDKEEYTFDVERGTLTWPRILWSRFTEVL
mmetsp:Transcript_29005/g.76032  ORF Transcript_29005/g.76032 Transcript_29005/m.76032 type:complete len:239 (-) Transcript_29005:582-1298(-)